MYFLTSISLASALIALSSAVPTLSSRLADFCPGMSYIAPDVECSSGFFGCVAYDKGSEICNGSKRFFNDCSDAPGLGSFYNCANGFIGCTTNPRICDAKPSEPFMNPYVQSPSSIPSSSSGTCRLREGSWYVCANGFIGCSTDPHVCDPKHSDPVVNPSNTTPPSASSECPAGSSYYVCANNGFRGCSSDPRICDMLSSTTAPISPLSKLTPPSSPSSSWTCPQTTWYAKQNECSSGFVGCTGETKACEGEKRFWGTCPPNHGNYLNCANGFIGCTTNNRICG